MHVIIKLQGKFSDMITSYTFLDVDCPCFNLYTTLIAALKCRNIEIIYNLAYSVFNKCQTKPLSCRIKHIFSKTFR